MLRFYQNKINEYMNKRVSEYYSTNPVDHHGSRLEHLTLENQDFDSMLYTSFFIEDISFRPSERFQLDRVEAYYYMSGSMFSFRFRTLLKNVFSEKEYDFICDILCKFDYSKKPKYEKAVIHIDNGSHIDNHRIRWPRYNGIGNIMKGDEDINFEEIWRMRPEGDQYARIFGKNIKVPRKYAVYGAQYDFSGQKNKPNPVPLNLKDFLKYGNSILINWYEDGNDYIGYHSDDEKGIVGDTYVFSFGATRNFKFQNKMTKVITTVKLEDGGLLIMNPDCQKHYKHSLPKMKDVGRRISITVRTMIVKCITCEGGLVYNGDEVCEGCYEKAL
jgi:alkylated DNA repair dioxygenase AlkB